MPETGDEKFGPEMLEEVIQEPTLDRYLDRSPFVSQPIDFVEMVRTLQKKRQWDINKKEKKENEQTD
jgi:hypothetical protein